MNTHSFFKYVLTFYSGTKGAPGPRVRTVLLVSSGAVHYFVLAAKLIFQNSIWQGAGVNTTSFCAIPMHRFPGTNCGRPQNNLIDRLDDANVTWLQKEEVTEGSFCFKLDDGKDDVIGRMASERGCHVSPFFSLHSWRLV